MPTYTQSIGIDVSKNKLDVALLGHAPFTVPNTMHGIQRILRLCQPHTSVIMEATGKYHQLCAITLASAGTNIAVLNPYHAKKLTDTSVRQRKTDAIDAQKLAQLGTHHFDTQRFMETREQILLKNKIGFVASLEKQIQSFSAILSSYKEGQEALSGSLSETEQLLATSIHHLKKQKRALEKEVQKSVRAVAGQAVTVVDSIPGVDQYVASLVVTYLKPEKRASEWVAYVGFDVSMNQSGKKNGRGYLTKRGNKYLRKRLYSAAWGASRHDAYFKNLYLKLRDQGRTYPEALCILARKLLIVAHAVLTTNTPYRQPI